MKISKLKPGYWKLYTRQSPSVAQFGSCGYDRLLWIRSDRSGKVIYACLDIVRECRDVDSLASAGYAQRLPELYGIVHIKHIKERTGTPVGRV
jgi:hypothetical protein